MNTVTCLRCLLVLVSLSVVSGGCAKEPAADQAMEKTTTTPNWRQPEAENLLYLQLRQGEVIIELAPGLAPLNVSNIQTLVDEHYYDGLAIIRSQDNYVVQWGDPDSDTEEEKSIGSAAATVQPEFLRAREGINVAVIDSRDAYADSVGFVDGFPIGGDEENVWLAHCYGMVGVARGLEPGSGNGSSLYVVTGHAPRHLDRNITLVGRVLAGMENLTSLPRGTGELGFYEGEDELTPIVSLRSGKQAPDRTRPEVMRTDSAAFEDYVRSRTHRNEEWFVDPTGRIELCNLHPPVRLPN